MTYAGNDLSQTAGRGHLRLSCWVTDAARRSKVQRFAEAAGWHTEFATSLVVFIEPADPGLTDLWISDRQDALDALPAAAMPRLLLARGGLQDRQTFETQVIAEINDYRLAGRFGQEPQPNPGSQAAEPVTRLPRYSELGQQLAGLTGQPLGLVVAEVDHAAHLYSDLDPISRTDLLAAVGAHLQQSLPAEARLWIHDAASFVVTLPAAGPGRLDRVARELIEAAAVPTRYRNGALHLTLSAGYALSPDFHALEPLWRDASAALRSAQHLGGNRALAAWEHGLARQLPLALTRDEFHLVYQPQYDLRSQQIRGAEVLLRWDQATDCPVAPAQFIHTAARAGYLTRVGDWVLEQTAQGIANLVETRLKRCVFGINVAPEQFQGGAILGQIQRLAKACWLDPSVLELELTQQELLAVIARDRSTLYQLRDLGVQIAVDRLGAQLIEVDELLRSPADTLKLDRSLVQRLPEDPLAVNLVQRLVDIAERYALETLAVGVETPAQQQTLTELGVSAQQGYALCEPITLGDFRALLGRTLARTAHRAT